tara:strand:- start:186 stop:431 length:246 start_codon:yes stop_codon:yes gene_type:complete
MSKDKYKRKFVGKVAVDSGCILISDPCYAKGNETPMKKNKLNVCSFTNYGDGLYNVYEEYIGKDRIGLFIETDNGLGSIFK